MVDEDELFAAPILLLQPAKQSVPFVFSSPHSGRLYPNSFLAASDLDRQTLRRSEDCFMDEIFGGVVSLGAPFLQARFPRAYLDVNREPYELDPTMFTDPLPPHVNTRSHRVAGGLGTIARIVAEATEIYRAPIAYSEAEKRIRHLYMPYHDALHDQLKQTLQTFGQAILIDCHSMPSPGSVADDFNPETYDKPDIVLGDRYGTSCAPALMREAIHILERMGYSVTRNNPYAGGFTTEHYGQPSLNLHALQIEINRALYMDEETLEKREGFQKIQADMTRFAAELVSCHIPLVGMEMGKAAQ